MNTRRFKYIALFFMLLVIFQQQLFAQAPKLVIGRILDKEKSEEKRKNIPFDAAAVGDIKVYYFNTKQEGRDIVQALNQDNISLPLSVRYVVPDSTGTYRVTLPGTGSLVIQVGTEPAVLEPVNGRTTIITYIDTRQIIVDTFPNVSDCERRGNMVGVNMVHTLGEVTVIGKYRNPICDDMICWDPGFEFMVFNNMQVYLPAKLGRSNARLVLQPYVIDVSNNEIVKKLRPHVYEGKRYRKILTRKLIHNKIKDSLAAYIMDEPLTEQAKKYHWTDTFQCPDFRGVYQAFVSVKLQNTKQTVYYEKIIPCSRDPRRVRRPMRFLEYSFDPYELNPVNYQEKPNFEWRCIGTTEIYRPLAKKEILERYQNDPDYHSGKKNFTLNEYWHLFNMLKAPLELEALYRRAYNYSRELNGGKPWVLAANNLAVSYLKRDTVDTEILRPLIDLTVRKCNLIRTFNGCVIGMDNVEEVVANQLEMYLKEESYSDAKRIVGILPDVEKYKALKAFVCCLGGDYKVKPGLSDMEIQQWIENFKLVSNSSPLNKVVMYLAMNGQDYDLIAEEALKSLPVNDTKTFYFKAILYGRRGENDMASKQLLECFKRDKEYLMIAKYDGDISANSYEQAKREYDEWAIMDKNI